MISETSASERVDVRFHRLDDRSHGGARLERVDTEEQLVVAGDVVARTEGARLERVEERPTRPVDDERVGVLADRPEVGHARHQLIERDVDGGHTEQRLVVVDGEGDGNDEACGTGEGEGRERGKGDEGSRWRPHRAGSGCCRRGWRRQRRGLGERERVRGGEGRGDRGTSGKGEAVRRRERG